MRTIHNGDRRYDAKAVLTRISLAKNAFVAPDEYEGNPADDYDEITQHDLSHSTRPRCGRARAFDFDDLIVEPVRLWPRDAATHTRVDGAVSLRDGRRVPGHQPRAARDGAPSRRGDHATCVSSATTTSRSTAGVAPTRRNILRFAELFPGAKVVKLEQNYRSTKHVLAAANAVIANNTEAPWQDAVVRGRRRRADHACGRGNCRGRGERGSAREIRALRDGGTPVERRRGAVPLEHAKPRSSRRSCARRGSLCDVRRPAVLRAQGGQGRLAYLRVALNPRDELALRRVINLPARGIGATTVDKLVAASQGRRQTLWDVLLNTEVHPGARTGLAALVAAVDGLRKRLDDGLDVVSAARGLVDDIGLYDDLRAGAASLSAAQRRIDNVEGLFGSLTRFAERGRGRDQLAEHLRLLALETSDEREQAGDRVVLTTLHGAKGLEFPVCFMIGLEEELLPHLARCNLRPAMSSTRTTRPTSARNVGCATSGSRGRSEDLFDSRLYSGQPWSRRGADAVAVPARDPGRAARGPRPGRGSPAEGPRGRCQVVLRHPRRRRTEVRLAWYAARMVYPFRPLLCAPLLAACGGRPSLTPAQREPSAPRRTNDRRTPAAHRRRGPAGRGVDRAAAYSGPGRHVDAAADDAARSTSTTSRTWASRSTPGRSRIRCESPLAGGRLARRVHGVVRVAGGADRHQPPLRAGRAAAKLGRRTQPGRGRLSRQDEGGRAAPAGPAQRVMVAQAFKRRDQGRCATGSTRSRIRCRKEDRREASKQLIAACEKDRPGIRCQRLEVLPRRAVRADRDARDQGRPAGLRAGASVGDYGGEVDNWEWPRHTGDWSFYRAYVGQDGKPADYVARQRAVPAEALAQGDDRRACSRATS